MHEGHWDLANPFSAEIILVHQIFIKHLICSCHFARPTDGNVTVKCIKKCKNAEPLTSKKIDTGERCTCTYMANINQAEDSGRAQGGLLSLA